MNKNILLAIIIVIFAASIAAAFYFQNSQVTEGPETKIELSEDEQIPNIVDETSELVENPPELAEEAELVGFQFMRDLVTNEDPDFDEGAAVRLYNSLSEEVRVSVDQDTLQEDLKELVGLETLPDMGVSVEDLQFPEEERAVLYVGLNYSESGQVMRALELVLENGEWRINSVDEV